MTHQWIKGALHLTAIALALLVSSTAQAQTGPVVSVTEGELTGITLDGVDQFRGIAYAKAPVGALRWVAPQPVVAWTGRQDATNFGAACPQALHPFADNKRNSEDCLFLNVYAPSGVTNEPRPVIVWIPGGGAVLGSAGQYDAQHLAQATNAVVVTMNYRLGALGWLWTSGMAAEAKGHNFALQDQQAALRWVRRNIASFHGDPQRVTLSGQSVGGVSVSLHLTSPTAAGLFQRAIMASGVQPPAMLNSAQAASKGDVFAATLGCSPGAGQLDCLRNKPVADILRVSPMYQDIGRDGLYWQAFIDGEMITNDVLPAVSKGEFNRVPVMVGSTKDEGRGFIPLSFHLDGTPMTEDEYVAATKKFIGNEMQPVLTGLMYPSSRLGSLDLAYAQLFTDGWFACQVSELAKKTSSYVPTYAYEFADRTAPEFMKDPFMEQGAAHASDLLYWFQTPTGGAPLSLNPAQLRLSDQMMRYWKQFAETGNPSGGATASGPVWSKFNKLSTPVLTLVPDAIHTQEWGAFQRAHQCTAWSLLYSLRQAGVIRSAGF